MPNELILTCRDEAATRSVGRELGNALVPGVTILLRGDLGSGKTVLVRGVGDALGAAHVKSPSFTLVNEYRVSCEKINLIAHADLYRLEDHGGTDALGLDEYITSDSVLFVEWPERWSNAPTHDVLSINFDSPSESTRVLTFTGTGLGEKIIRALAVMESGEKS